LNKHVLLLLAAAILWSLGGVLIKSIDWTPLAIAGSRSLIAIVVIGLVMPGVGRKISWRILPGALAYAGTVVLFVIATKLTSAANAIFLQYTAPIYIAIISPWVLHERTKPLDWLLILVALCGVALFFVDQLSFEGLSGVIAALASGMSFAWLTVFMRRHRNESRVNPASGQYPDSALRLTMDVSFRKPRAQRHLDPSAWRPPARHPIPALLAGDQTHPCSRRSDHQHHRTNSESNLGNSRQG